ncbi:MAG: S9 family peptidase [Phycisphaerae bacterium]|nr:S9 family peptidase [Phycisphaerae bacterium]
MSKSRLLVLASAGLLPAVLLLPLGGCAGTGHHFDYPKAHKGNVVDVYHGVEVADPYRWLENPDSPESQAWIKAENQVTFDFLNSIDARSAIRERITELWDYEKRGMPKEEGGRFFYSKNDGLQNQSVLYVADSLNAAPRVLLDPNKLSDDGTVALSGTAVNDNGQLLAYGVSSGGSDWEEWHVRDVNSARDLSDVIKWVKFSGASWTKDGKGFFYSRYDAPDPSKELQEANYYQKLYYHVLGTPQSDDILVYHRPDQKEWGFGGGVTDDGRYLVINVWKGTDRRNLVFYKDLQFSAGSTLDNIRNAPVVELINEFEAAYSPIANRGTTFWIRTDKDAPRSRIISIDLSNPSPANWKEIVPQNEDVLEGANIVGGKLFATYMKDAHNVIRVFTPEGRSLGEVELPGLGSAGGFGGKWDEKETFYAFSSFSDPGTIFRYDVNSGDSSIWFRPRVDFDPDRYVTRQIFYQSKDGTRVPMFITHKKGLELNGNNPTILYGYGGFDISLTPFFRVNNLVWMEMGGVFAVPNLRGGGEYGKEWHEAGMKLKKQNVFDDFIAAAEWLIDNGYTRPAKLAISGASNGGLLVGAAMTQRPDLFGAALPAVGVMDMLRFEQFTIGWAWTSDYGSVKNEDEFKALYAYSPLQNIKRGTRYPATLITTADHDDRVVPAHSFKFAATLQEAHRGDNPVLIRIETRAGHGAGKPTSKRIEEAADQLAFLTAVLRMDVDPAALGWNQPRVANAAR